MAEYIVDTAQTEGNAMTSDERRKIAAKLRALTDGKSPMAECSVNDLYTALGMPWPCGGIEHAVIEYLADLIDPTCKVSSVETYDDELGQLEGWEFHLTCGHSFQRPWNEPPAYCPECGARVVR